jgi:glycosyltransferase involved in cell wall biosynthesis
MRVAIFTDNDFGKVNGVTTTLKAVLRERPADIHARVYTAADVGVDRDDYLALHSYGINIPFYRGMKMYLPRFAAFLEHVRKDGADVIHYTTPGPVGLAAMYVSWRLGVPMMGSFHTQLAEYTELLSGSRRLGELMRQYQRWPYGKCARVLVPSEATRQLLIATKIRPERIRIWTRGVDTEKFSPAHRSDALRFNWRAKGETLALLYVGRLSREKGLDAIPALARSLNEVGIAHRFIFAGDGPFRAELKHACPSAVFMGEVPHEDVPKLMASADLFVFPSRTDTLGNVVLEAQASGLPVLVSDEGGPRENMINGETGYVCAGRDHSEMMLHLHRLARDPVRRQRMSAAAREYALGRSWSKALAPLYETYREVAAEHRARQAAAGVTSTPAAPANVTAKMSANLPVAARTWRIRRWPSTSR